MCFLNKVIVIKVNTQPRTAFNYQQNGLSVIWIGFENTQTKQDSFPSSVFYLKNILNICLIFFVAAAAAPGAHCLDLAAPADSRADHMEHKSICS